MAAPAARNFIADPEDAGLSTVVGDMAALNLELIAAVRDVLPEAGQRAVDAIADRTQNVLAASNASQARERATRELQPITRVPLVPFGIVNNVANIRMNNVPTFSGTDKDTLDIVRWLSRILTLADASNLTFDATISLMIQGSSNGAADYVEQMRDEGKTLSQVIQMLEMRYGDLCAPDEARVKCNNMPRKDVESLSEFIDRLRMMARMACRSIADNVARRQSMDVLVEGNIRRVLPSSVRHALEERVVNRSRMGLPAFTAREVEKECLDLERRRDERRGRPAEPVVARRHARAVQAAQHGFHQIQPAQFNQAQLAQIHQISQGHDSGLSSSEDDLSSADEVDTNDNATYYLVNEIKQQERKYLAKGKPFDREKVYRRAFHRYNEKFPPPRAPRPTPGNYGARQAGIVGAGGIPQPAVQGPPNNLDTKVRRTIAELLALANCTRGHCIQCGFEGHYMHGDACVLKDKPLVDRPCAKCNTGLHSADCCPKVYQQQYVAPPQLAQPANLVQGDALKDQ